ncbi:MAG: hypothetical protein RML92_07230, partial [Bacteroidia bacterium]|nr:hypothetical protein [Bacteroidia bacterium]
QFFVPRLQKRALLLFGKMLRCNVIGLLLSHLVNLGAEAPFGGCRPETSIIPTFRSVPPLTSSMHPSSYDILHLILPNQIEGS